MSVTFYLATNFYPWKHKSQEISHSKKELTANYMLEGVAHFVVLLKIPKDNSMLKTLRNSTADTSNPL